MPPPSSSVLRLPLNFSSPIQSVSLSYLLPSLSFPFHHSPPPFSSSSFKPFAAAGASSSSSLSTSFPYPHQTPTKESDDLFDDDELVIGDCLVFDDDAFEGVDPFDGPAQPPPREREGQRGRRRPAREEAAQSESLVPPKWKEAVQEINLTKKEKRRIAHKQRFGSRLERRSKPTMPDMEEYNNYREMKLAQLKPVVLDIPRKFPKEEEDVVPVDPPELGSRLAPRNPRLGLGDEGTLEDIADFFNSGRYVPGEAEDDTKPQGRRKLFTQEEKVLLNKRIPNLAEATSSKWVPLHSLAASGEFYLLDTLLKHNVEINAVDKDGLSALHKAILCKKQAIINYLLRNSANPFVRDRDGATLLHYAVQTASSQTIKILLLYNVDINLSDDDGWSPLHLAVQTKRTDIVRLLLIKGADRTLRNRDGSTPLNLCLYSGHDLRTFELIKLLKQLPLSN